MNSAASLASMLAATEMSLSSTWQLLQSLEAAGRGVLEAGVARRSAAAAEAAVLIRQADELIAGLPALAISLGFPLLPDEIEALAASAEAWRALGRAIEAEASRPLGLPARCERDLASALLAEA